MDLLLISAAETAADDGGFLGVVKTVNDAVSGVVWGWPALILLLFVGVLMSVLTKFFQIAHRKVVQMHHRRGIQGQKGHGAHKGQADIPVPERMRGARLNGRDR